MSEVSDLIQEIQDCRDDLEDAKKNFREYVEDKLTENDFPVNDVEQASSLKEFTAVLDRIIGSDAVAELEGLFEGYGISAIAVDGENLKFSFKQESSIEGGLSIGVREKNGDGSG